MPELGRPDDSDRRSATEHLCSLSGSRSVRQLVCVGEQVRTDALSEQPTSGVLQLLGQVGVSRTLEPVPAHAHRHLGYKLGCRVANEE